MTTPNSAAPKVLVTGAAGRLGNVIVRTLLEHGYAVRAGLHSNTGEHDSLAGLAFESCTVDLTKPETLDAAVQGCQYVMHLASVVSLRAQDTEWMEQVNVAGTRHLLAVARRAGVRRFIFAGSCDAFLVPSPGALINERTPLAVNADHTYSRTKAQATQLCLGASDEQMTVLTIAPTSVTGPYDFGPSLQTAEFLRGAASPAAVIANASFDFVDVRDVAATFVNALTRGRGGEVYLAGGQQAKQEQAVRAMRDASGLRGTPIFSLRPRAIVLALSLKAVADRLLRRPDDGLLRSIRVLAQEPRYDSIKAQQELGHQSRPVEESFADLAAFLVETGKLRHRRSRR